MTPNAGDDHALARFDTRYGTMYALSEDPVIGRSLREYGEWAEHEIDELSRFIVDEGIILDVGANIGTHALAFARRFPHATVFALEPQPLPCAMLLANVVENNVRNVRVLNLGASDETAVIQVRLDYDALEKNVGAFAIERFRSGEPGAYPLLVSELDRIVAGGDVKFIKVDVEGMEAQVLRGAAGVLQQQRPIVFFEALTAEGVREPAQLLVENGYDLFWLETWPFNANNYRGNATNVWSICELGILAIPKERSGRVDLPPASGNETELPHHLDPYGGFGLPDGSVAGR